MKRVIWGSQIYNLFREKFKFRGFTILYVYVIHFILGMQETCIETKKAEAIHLLTFECDDMGSNIRLSTAVAKGNFLLVGQTKVRKQ